MEDLFKETNAQLNVEIIREFRDKYSSRDPEHEKSFTRLGGRLDMLTLEFETSGPTLIGYQVWGPHSQDQVSTELHGLSHEVEGSFGYQFFGDVKVPDKLDG